MFLCREVPEPPYLHTHPAEKEDSQPQVVLVLKLRLIISALKKQLKQALSIQKAAKAFTIAWVWAPGGCVQYFCTDKN